MNTVEVVRPEWKDERTRYRILDSVYRRAGGTCTESVAASAIADDLGIASDRLRRILAQLAEGGYLFAVGPGPLVCITPRGIRYIEKSAGRRKSLRLARSA